MSDKDAIVIVVAAIASIVAGFIFVLNRGWRTQEEYKEVFGKKIIGGSDYFTICDVDGSRTRIHYPSDNMTDEERIAFSAKAATALAFHDCDDESVDCEEQIKFYNELKDKGLLVEGEE